MEKQLVSNIIAPFFFFCCCCYLIKQFTEEDEQEEEEEDVNEEDDTPVLLEPVITETINALFVGNELKKFTVVGEVELLGYTLLF